MHSPASNWLLIAACVSTIGLGACDNDRPRNAPAADSSASAPPPASTVDSAARAAQTPHYPIVGGAAMYPTKDIVENASNSRDHTTLVMLLKAADLVPTLKGHGPFTVFAPTNRAFNLLKQGTVDTLLKPENRGKLKSLLTYHVIAGRLDAADLARKIQEGNGVARLKTVNGTMLSAAMDGNQVVLKDESGAIIHVTAVDAYQSNGVIHVVDAVMMPQ
ncbi:MAG: fasciclin domain-containing protein [Bacteroidetes bacterium]|nr:fasciclin domain-containing protein [Bacteroidota bacterium]